MNETFRLGIVSTLYRPALGGPVTYLAGLVGRLGESSVETLVLVPEGSEVLAAPRVHYAFFRRRHRLKYADYFVSELCLLWALAGVLARVRVLYCHGVDVALGVLTFLTRRPRWPRVVQRFAGYPPWENMIRLRGDMSMSLEGFSGLSFGQIWRRYGLVLAVFDRLHRRSLSAMDAVITPGHYLASVLRRLGVPPEKIHVIHNAVPPASTVKGEDGPAGRREGGLRLVTACRLVPHKGLEELLAWTRGRPDCRLEIVGEGPEKERLQGWIASRQCRNVELLGAMEAARLHERIRRADVFVLNSLYEGFSHALLEALSLGTCYAATRIPGNEEVHRLLGGLGGSLFEPHDEAGFWKAVEESAARSRGERDEARRVLHETLAGADVFSDTLNVLLDRPRGKP